MQIGGSVGTVNELSLFWTELVTDDKVQIIVPNGGVWGQPLRNFSVYPAPPHSGDVRFRIAEGTSPIGVAYGKAVDSALRRCSIEKRVTIVAPNYSVWTGSVKV